MLRKWHSISLICSYFTFLKSIFLSSHLHSRNQKFTSSKISGLVGVISMLVLSLHNELHVVFALLFITAGSAGVAISDVTIDACAAENSIARPTIAADIQSLCAFSSSIGALLGFSVSGLLVHLMGSQVSCHPTRYKIDHIHTRWSSIQIFFLNEKLW